MSGMKQLVSVMNDYRNPNADSFLVGIGAPEGVNNETAFLAAVANRFEELDLSEETINQFAEVYPNNNTRGCPFHTGGESRVCNDWIGFTQPLCA